MTAFLTLDSAAQSAELTAVTTYVQRRLQALGHRVVDVTDAGRAPVAAALVVASGAEPAHVRRAVAASGAHVVLVLGTHVRDIDESATALAGALDESGTAVVRANPLERHHVLLFADGGFVLSSRAATALQHDIDSLVGVATGRSGSDVAPAAGPASVIARRVPYHAPELAELLADLRVEYATRYARETANTTLTEVPATDFAEPRGTFVVLLRGGRTVAGGAIRRLDDETAEIKRVWTTSAVRRQGFGRRVIDELEDAAADLGYSRIFLSTGPRQPEARALYLAAGYRPGFDLDAPPESVGRHVFTKTLHRHTASPDTPARSEGATP